MAQQAFDVIRKNKVIDTVFATGYTEEEMYRSLVNHDGYPADIVVKERKADPRAYTRLTP